MNDAARIFRQPDRWLNFKSFNSSVVYTINHEYELIFATDHFALFDGQKVKKIEVPDLGLIKHALFSSWLAENPDIVMENSFVFKAKEIRKRLEKLDYSDAHNPALWKRSIIVKGIGMPVYGFTNFVKLGLFTEEQYRKLITFAQNGESKKIYDFVLKAYKAFTGNDSYSDFIRSPLMSSS